MAMRRYVMTIATLMWLAGCAPRVCLDDVRTRSVGPEGRVAVVYACGSDATQRIWYALVLYRNDVDADRKRRGVELWRAYAVPPVAVRWDDKARVIRIDVSREDVRAEPYHIMTREGAYGWRAVMQEK